VSKRYTIEFSIKEVDEDGDTFGPEIAGVTMDWATTHLESLERCMDELYKDSDTWLHNNDPDGDNNITPRHLEE
jgi:hypothetical protein